MFAIRKEEAEVLCPPGTQFKVLDRSELPDGKIRIIMREVNE